MPAEYLITSTQAFGREILEMLSAVESSDHEQALRAKASQGLSLKGRKRSKRQPNSYPTEVQSQSWSHGSTHGTQFPTIHSQPVLVGGGAIEVVFELCWKGGLRLLTVQASPLLITAGCAKRKAQSTANKATFS